MTTRDVALLREPRPPDAYAMTPAQEEAAATALVHVLGDGDLLALEPIERVGHYMRLCRSLGLNPLSRPFDWLMLKDRDDGPERLILYANQSCAAQLRRQHHMRVEITRREVVGDLFVVEARATTPDGRCDISSKYVPISGQYGRYTGKRLANAMMTAETGAKRRVTLSMVGLAEPPGPDEGAQWRHVVIDGVGQVVPNPTPEQKYLAENPRAARVLGEPVFEDVAVDDGEVVSQAATADEVERPPAPAGPAPSFKPSATDVKRWLGAWFASVKGTSLDADDARHTFVRQWCSQYPDGIRTESLREFFEHATERQAADLLAHVRAIVDGEKAELLADATNAREEPDEEERPF